MRTYDCEPTLNDLQVLDFCHNGYLMLEGVVPDEINKKTTQFLEERTGETFGKIVDEDWFVDNVLTNPQAAGAVRSLLGKDFSLTMPYMANHQAEGPGASARLASGRRLCI